MNDLSETFGCKVFNDAVMRERLPAEVYESIRSAVELGTPIPRVGHAFYPLVPADDERDG